MKKGDVVAERFVIERPVGSGGMGRVYCALDRLSGEVIALKLLHRAEPRERLRFAREAQALATLRHPGIVRYVAHGSTADGSPYLAMEWLDGETLFERMARKPLTIAESVLAITRVAAAVGAVHRHGVVHRDLKPSNLYLAQREIERMTLIDFGIAHRLRGERDAFEATRTLLGRTTPCVGRERELALLEATFAHTIAEGTASAVLITGAAGMGKSRVGHELLRRLREQRKAAAVWIARGDPMSAGSAFSLLGQALRRTLGLRDGEPVEARRKRIRARTHRHAAAGRLANEGDAAARADRMAEFLGELAGAPFLDDDSVQLRAARRDPMLMGDQMRRAFEDLLRAECIAGPVLLVLEDLHWGDLPTVKFVDAALRTLVDQPLMVLALARPEVHELFPRLWAGRALQEVKLGELSRRAGERLVHEALGDDHDPATTAALVQRSAGNAFYLEELIRATAEGRSAALPETVLAMAQSRIEEQDAEARRILRAASVFGQTFCKGDAFSRNKASPRESLKF